MNKRKKASSSKSRRARGAHPSAPPKSAQPAPIQLPLPAACLVSDADSLKEHLAGLLDEPLPVRLNVTALQRIDTAGLQLITAFVRERAGRGRLVEWQGSAPALTTAAQLLGLASVLKLPA